jgi:protein-tyrosine phosphatase
VNIALESEPAIASQILKNLWMGNAPPIGWGVSGHFDDLVLCAKEYQLASECFPGVEVIHAPMNDDGTPMTSAERVIATKTAANVIRRLIGGRRVLVTCRAGRNRSGIVSALALCMGPYKYTPVQAVTTIRRARGQHAMVNPYFLEFLQQFHNQYFKQGP